MKLLAFLLTLLPVAMPASDPIVVDFGTLAGFDYVEGMKLPAEVTRLDTKRVTISGFMQRELPGSGPVEFFMLINDGCGCEGTPMLNEIVFAAMPEGETTEVKPGIVKITGTLYVGEQKEDGEVFALYVMDVESISDRDLRSRRPDAAPPSRDAAAAWRRRDLRGQTRSYRLAAQ